MGDTWVHLRICLTCGNVGCCDSSKNKHATKQFHATKHPVKPSFEPGEDWMWCYVDELMFEEDCSIAKPTARNSFKSYAGNTSAGAIGAVEGNGGAGGVAADSGRKHSVPQVAHTRGAKNSSVYDWKKTSPGAYTNPTT